MIVLRTLETELRIAGVYLHWLGNKFSVALESVSRGDVTENVITLYPNLLVLPLLVLYLVGVFIYLSFSFSENLSLFFFFSLAGMSKVVWVQSHQL